MTGWPSLVPALAILWLAACSGDPVPDSGAAAGDGSLPADDGGAPGDAALADTAATAPPVSLPPARAGCDGAKLLELPDFTKPGPWPVGARTIQAAGFTTEVWYPAVPGSQIGKESVRYDLREFLPDNEKGKIPDDKNPWQVCSCVRDLPPDMERGPYPVIAFVHGTAAFRTQSLTFMTHWASRGFIVISSDHPGLWLKDALNLNISGKPAENLAKILDELVKLEGETAFLKGVADIHRIAVTGHSAGGNAIAGMASREGVRVVMPMAAGGVTPGRENVQVLILGAQDDGIVAWKRQSDGFSTSPKPKRLVGLKNAGHLAFSDLCLIGADQGGILKIARDHGVNVNSLIASLARDGCKQGQLEPQKGFDIILFAASSLMEPVLHCAGDAPLRALAGIRDRFPDVSEYREEL
ncbi:MAG: hypothetical protein GMKNLPBB_01773 [Myxococcota bacterium]|nr:hypothetical protein [Myxococcota bacterium]